MSPLVFLHGLGGGKAVWDRQTEHFRALGYRCTAWDQPGYGQSPLVDPYTFENLAEVLGGLVGEKAILVGHSMGGLVAQEFYARHPEKVAALALCFTSAAFAAGTHFAEHFVQARIGPLDAGRSMAEIAADVMPAQRGRITEPDAVQRAERIMAGVPPATYRKAVQIRHDLRPARGPAEDRGTRAAGGRQRRRHRAGSADGRHGAENPRRRVRGDARLRPPRPLDQPDAFNKVLEGFLRRRKL